MSVLTARSSLTNTITPRYLLYLQSTKQRLLKTFPDHDYPVSNSEEIETWSPGGGKIMDDPTGVRVEAGDRTHDEKDKLSAACKLLGLSEGFELDGACKN